MICRANQLTGLYMKATLALNGLIFVAFWFDSDACNSLKYGFLNVYCFENCKCYEIPLIRASLGWSRNLAESLVCYATFDLTPMQKKCFRWGFSIFKIFLIFNITKVRTLLLDVSQLCFKESTDLTYGNLAISDFDMVLIKVIARKYRFLNATVTS